MVIKVHTYHINIDVGDSAIHLLVDEAIVPLPRILARGPDRWWCSWSGRV